MEDKDITKLNKEAFEANVRIVCKMVEDKFGKESVEYKNMLASFGEMLIILMKI